MLPHPRSRPVAWRLLPSMPLPVHHVISLRTATRHGPRATIPTSGTVQGIDAPVPSAHDPPPTASYCVLRAQARTPVALRWRPWLRAEQSRQWVEADVARRRLCGVHLCCTHIEEALLKFSTAVADVGSSNSKTEWSLDTAQLIVDLRTQPDEMLFLRRAVTGRKVCTVICTLVQC